MQKRKSVRKIITVLKLNTEGKRAVEATHKHSRSVLGYNNKKRKKKKEIPNRILIPLDTSHRYAFINHHRNRKKRKTLGIIETLAHAPCDSYSFFFFLFFYILCSRSPLFFFFMASLLGRGDTYSLTRLPALRVFLHHSALLVF